MYAADLHEGDNAAAGMETQKPEKWTEIRKQADGDVHRIFMRWRDGRRRGEGKNDPRGGRATRVSNVKYNEVRRLLLTKHAAGQITTCDDSHIG